MSLSVHRGRVLKPLWIPKSATAQVSHTPADVEPTDIEGQPCYAMCVRDKANHHTQNKASKHLRDQVYIYNAKSDFSSTFHQYYTHTGKRPICPKA